MPKLRGITIILHTFVETGRDPFNAPVMSEVDVEVENVIVAPEERAGEVVFSSTDLSSRRATYLLGVPKGDANHWENNEVEFFGRRWKVIGLPTEGIEDMIPLSWNKIVRVEAIE